MPHTLLGDNKPVPITLTHRLVHHADPIKGSRFRATVVPVETAPEALQQVAAIKAADPDATHHCWAYRLGDGSSRSADEGEPGGSAGKPILARLEGRDWVGVLVVVSRWYGGTRLGVGGLIRAYGRTAAEALARAVSVPFVATTTLTLRFDYGDQGAVTGVLEAGGATVLDTVYTTDVVARVRVPESGRPELLQALADATSGRLREV